MFSQIGVQPGGDGAGGDMQQSVYDPAARSADAFNRENHTGALAIATVTGLQSALDAKAPGVHTHTLADVAAAIETAELTLANNANTSITFTTAGAVGQLFVLVMPRTAENAAALFLYRFGSGGPVLTTIYVGSNAVVGGNATWPGVGQVAYAASNANSTTWSLSFRNALGSSQSFRYWIFRA